MCCSPCSHRVGQGLATKQQQVIWIKWAPPLKQSQFTILSLSGLLLGCCTVLHITEFICDSLGWLKVFYTFGASGCALNLPWFILFYDDPKNHLYISISEKEYITSTLIQQQVIWQTSSSAGIFSVYSPSQNSSPLKDFSFLPSSACAYFT